MAAAGVSRLRQHRGADLQFQVAGCYGPPTYYLAAVPDEDASARVCHIITPPRRFKLVLNAAWCMSMLRDRHPQRVPNDLHTRPSTAVGAWNVAVTRYSTREMNKRVRGQVTVQSRRSGCGFFVHYIITRGLWSQLLPPRPFALVGPARRPDSHVNLPPSSQLSLGNGCGVCSSALVRPGTGCGQRALHWYHNVAL